MKNNKKFTIMVIPHSKDSPLVFNLPLNLVQIFGVVILGVIMLSICLATNYINMTKSLDELDNLRLENIKKQAMIDELAKETQILIEEFEEFKELQEKIKDLTVQDYKQAQDNSVVINDSLFASSRGADTYERASRSVVHLSTSLPEKKAQMTEMVDNIEAENKKKASTPSIWPTWGNITSPFGNRRGPFTGRIEFHSGVDIANSIGTPVQTTADGRVVVASYKGGWGNLVVVEHGYGYSTYYAHLSKIEVKQGERVEKGQVIGYVGNTGNSTGPHLHYEVRVRGNPINPRSYMK